MTVPLLLFLFTLSLSLSSLLLLPQTAVVRKDFETANSILPSIPKTEYTAVARFLESQGFKEEAFQVWNDTCGTPACVVCFMQQPPPPLPPSIWKQFKG